MVDRLKYLAHGFAQFGNELVRSRRLIYELTRREFRSRYLGSAFGLIWAFIQPAVLMLIYWLVFHYAFHSDRDLRDGVPFVVWLLTGLVPWFILSDLMMAGTGVIMDNRFLVKKVVFRVSLLPVVRLLSLLPVHLFFVLLIIVIDWGYGYPPSWCSLQVLYYMAAMLVLALGWSWLVSAIVPFLKDVQQVIQVLLQILFWLTPLIYPISVVSTDKRWILYLNPLVYIVQGYRESLLNQLTFWHHPIVGAYYWAASLMLLAVGGIVFVRLRPHFADVL